MRKILFVVFFAALASAAVFADGASVAIQNEESSAFYYVVDPPELAGLSAGSPMASTRLAEYFAAQVPEPGFTQLAPGAQTSITGLSNGTHLLVGFFATEDQDTFPVRAVSLQADSAMGERFYAIFATPSMLDATRGVGRLAQFGRGETAVASAPPGQEAPAEQPAPAAEQPAPAAGQPAATEPAAAEPSPAAAEPAPAAPTAQAPAPEAPASGTPAPKSTAIASFSPSYDPVYFTQETQAGFSVQPIGQSKSWGSEGTHITSVTGSIDGQKLTLAVGVAEGFSENVSYFLYVFSARKPGTADDLTVELRPRALPDKGACILWRKGEAPRMFGTVSVSGNTATLEANLADLPADIASSLGAGATFDLTSCSFDKSSGTYEEFYFATVAMADIPVVTR